MHVAAHLWHDRPAEGLVRSQLWPTADLSSVRFLITGGAPVPEPLIGAYLERGLTLLQGYGLSEAAPVALLLRPDSALSKVGSAGTPPLFVDTKIVGSDDGAVGPFQTGELMVRGPNVMAGYWNRPEETAEVLSADGWLRTGDAARSDEDGYIWIVGRIVDSFISRGQVVHPGDVERVLLTHPGVAEAGVAAASGSGAEQVGTAFVVLAPGVVTTDQELMAWSRERLSAHQLSARVTLVDRLPRNSVGKLIRGDLREMARCVG